MWFLSYAILSYFLMLPMCYFLLSNLKDVTNSREKDRSIEFTILVWFISPVSLPIMTILLVMSIITFYIKKYITS